MGGELAWCALTGLFLPPAAADAQGAPGEPVEEGALAFPAAIWEKTSAGERLARASRRLRGEGSLFHHPEARQ